MPRRTWPLLVSLLAAAPAAALEPGDLVIGVGASLFAVDPRSGAQELLSEGPELGAVTSIAVRSDGTVFFALTSPLTGTDAVWRFDPRSGERSLLVPPVASPGFSIGGLALDRRGRLVVAYADAELAPGAQPDVAWLDAETGEALEGVPLPGNVLGISDLALDAEGRALLTIPRAEPSSRSPRTQAPDRCRRD